MADEEQMEQQEASGEVPEATETETAEAVAEEPAVAADADGEPETQPETPPVGEVEAEPEPTDAEPQQTTEVVSEDAEPVAALAKPKKKRLPRPLRRQRSKPTREKPDERRPIVRLEKPEHVRGRRQERQGTVVSSASDKTIVVRVDVVKIHPRYKKVIRRSTKFHAHDETNEAKVGDLVKIVETRPISRMKRWRLQEIVRAAK
jgi:small subunit ribosomal protein S17